MNFTGQNYKKLFFLIFFKKCANILNVKSIINIIVIFIFLRFSLLAEEAKIVLENGGFFYGEIIQQEDGYVLVEIKRGSIGLHQDEIASIIYNPQVEINKKNYITISNQTTYLEGPTCEEEWDSLIGKMARRYQLDPFLVKAIMKVESDFDPYNVSHKGASGLMQLMPETAIECGVCDIFNPEENVEGGAKYLRYLLDAFKGDLKLALAGYNAGPNIVRKHKGIPPYRETRNYIKEVLYNYNYYKNE